MPQSVVSRLSVVAIVVVAVLGLIAPHPASAKESKGLALLESIENVFVEVAELVQTGVVSISPTEADIEKAMRNPHGFGPDAPSHPQIPDGQNPHGPGMPNLPNLPSVPDNSPGSGTGVILDESGHVVTNAHVVGDAEEMIVALIDGRKFTAKVIGRDADTDLAVLKIEDGKDLPVLPLGDSDQVKPGQWAIAVGNPFGLERTVTVGIVSGVGREGVNLTRYENFIQTDAPINPGNSGGPLFNIHGEVIGINTAIMSFAQGIGFAIPTNMVKRVTDQLMAHGTVKRGWLGVGIQNIGPELAESFGVDEGAGVLVNQVFADQPAERSGILPGDIIVALNGKDVNSPNTLARLIAALSPDSEARIEFLRDGHRQSVTAVLSNRDHNTKVAAITLPKPALPAQLGLDLQEMTPELAEQLDVDGSGIVVARVTPGSPAFERGMREGDVIREWNRIPVATMDDLEQALKSGNPGEKVLLRTTRQGSGRYVVLAPGDE